MRMKKVLAGFCCALMLVALTACAAQPGGGMQLSRAELTEEEESILSLLGGSRASIFDFTMDESIKTVRIERYELGQDGKWQSFGGGSFALSGKEGRLALSLDPTGNEIRLAVQDEHGTSAIKHSYPTSGFAGMSAATSMAPAKTAIVPDQEIPLVVQILTAKDKTVSYSVDYFFHPEEYAQHGYEHVYAVTATFSANPLS